VDAEALYTLGFALIFAGILIVLVAFIVFFVSSAKGKAKMKGGGAIIIGPIPIIFGTDKESLRTILLLSLALTLLLVIVIVVLHFMSG
jgi:uncharacterized protein (TIGR00304 family)